MSLPQVLDPSPRRLAIAEADALLASSLDLAKTLANVVRLVVPSLADLGFLDLIADDGALQRVEVAVADPAKASFVDAIRRAAPPRGSPHPTARAAATGESILLPDFSDVLMQASANDDEHLTLIRAFGVRSVLAVPLTARGRTIGVLTCVTSEPGRRIGEDDLGLAEELARRAAVAIDNARLYEAARQAEAALRANERRLEAARRRLDLLARVSAVMARSLDYESRLKELAHLLIPDLGDVSTVSVIGPGGAIQRLIDAGVNDAVQEQVERARSAPVPAGLRTILQPAFETGRALYFPEYLREVVSRLPQDDPYVVATRDLAPTEVVFVALRARGRALGYLSVAMVGSGRGYAAEDLTLLEEIAERAALAIDNARLFREAEAERARLYSLFMQAPAAICILRGPELVFELLNPLYQRLLGERRSIVGKPLRAALPELEGQGFFELIERVYATGEPFFGHELPARLDRRGDGALDDGFFDFIYQPMMGEGGAVEGVMILASEVTDRVRARRRSEALTGDLRRSEERYRATFEQAPLGVAHVALDGRFLRANAKFEEITGYRRDELLALTSQGITHPDDVAADLALRARLCAGELGTCVLEKRYIRKDGTPVWVSLTRALVRTPEGAPDYFIVILEDIAERRRLEEERARLFAAEQRAREQAEAADRLKDQFLGIVSHELRTPLNAMLGWTRMLRSGALPEDRRGRALETIERNAQSLAQIVDDLLDVARIVAGKLRLEMQPVNLPSVIEAAIDVARPAADAREIRLLPVLDPDASSVVGDPGRLQQVIWNLLANAVKFSPRGGEVRIVLERADGAAEIRVIDEGQGIDPAFLPHVFEQFRQAEDTTTRKQGGLGLGLSIVKHLVELHGGTIQAQSEGRGRGATFVVRLPLAVPNALSVEAGAARAKAPSVDGLECPPEIAGLKVLIVDDDADARGLLVALLQPCGARALATASVSEAIAALDGFQPDLIVSDIGMPGEDGYALIQRIRARRPEQGGRVPVVALTAFARSEDRTRALRAGFNTHVPKPIDPAELLAVLASLAPRSTS